MQWNEKWTETKNVLGKKLKVKHPENDEMHFNQNKQKQSNIYIMNICSW